MNKLSQFWQELKRRNVVRRNTVYAATAFVILEVVSIVQDPLKLPEWTLTLVIVLLLIGFLVSIILSWIYDINPEGGLEKTKPVHKVKNDYKQAESNSWKIASYLSFVVIIALIVLNIIPRSSQSKDREILDKSIAVLPFINDSQDQDNEHLINGIMEDLLINLQTIKDLRVPGRTSTEKYRNNPKPIPEIAAEMNVAYIVEGSGQRYGNKIRLRVQLVEGATDKHIWADSYDEEIEGPEDIFRIQSQIAEAIAKELEAAITPEEKQLIKKVSTTSLTALDFYQRGREEYVKYMLDNDNKEALDRAEDLYYKALDYDSAFALAYTGLAQIYREKNYWEELLTENFLDSMLILADIALSFDDQLAEAYLIRGEYYKLNTKDKEAISEYDKAIKINPNFWEAYWSKGDLYLYDDLIKAIDNYQKASLLHRGPFLPTIYQDLAFVYAGAGFEEKSRYYLEEKIKLDNDSASYYNELAFLEEGIPNYEKAIKYDEKAYAIDSTIFWVVYHLALYHSYLGQFEESLRYFKEYDRRFKVLDKPHPNGTFRIGHAYWVNGLKDEAEYYFNSGMEFHNEAVELGRRGNYSYYNLAAAHAFLGDREKAYEYLILSDQEQVKMLFVIATMKNDPLFASIRDEREFQLIVREVEAQYQAEHERVRLWLEDNDML